MISRKAGRLVSFGMLCGAIAGCGTPLDPRLQVSAELRQACTKNGITYSDDTLRGILISIESRRLRGSTKEEEYQTGETDCVGQGLMGDNLVQCFSCYNACVAKVFGPF